MNPDLEFRLSIFGKYDDALTFFDKLVERLSLCVDEKTRVVFESIENGEDDSAYAVYTGDTFVVVIDDRMPYGMMLDFLIHELAHVDSWMHYEDDDHGPEWGKSYARLYRCYLDIYGELIDES